MCIINIDNWSSKIAFLVSLESYALVKTSVDCYVYLLVYRRPFPLSLPGLEFPIPPRMTY